MISFGQVFLELVFGHVPGLPLPGEEVFTDEFAISCGGAVTSAISATQGGARAGVCTVLGNDFGSRVVAEHLSRHGVDLSPSVRVPGRSTGITVVLNFDGDRSFVTHVPPLSGDATDQISHWRDVLRRERPRWCYLHAGAGVPAFLREARALGSRVVLDTTLGDERHRSTVAECVSLADVFVPNEAELRRLTGEDALDRAVAAAAAWGTPLVVKRGAAGALVADRGGITEVTDGVEPVEVRDLTGAGDSFAGAMIAALLKGTPLAGAVVAANAAGSRTVGQLGAVGEVDISEIGPQGIPGGLTGGRSGAPRPAGEGTAPARGTGRTAGTDAARGRAAATAGGGDGAPADPGPRR